MKFFVGDKVRAIGLIWGPDERDVGVIVHIIPHENPRSVLYGTRYKKGVGVNNLDGLVPAGCGIWLKAPYMKLATPSENRK